MAMTRRKFYNDTKGLLWETGFNYGQRSSFMRRELDYGKESSVMRRKFCNDNNDLLWEGSSILEKEAIRTNTMRRGFDYEKGVPTAKVSSIMRRKMDYGYDKKKVLQWQKRSIMRSGVQLWTKKFCYEKRVWLWKRKFCDEKKIL